MKNKIRKASQGRATHVRSRGEGSSGLVMFLAGLVVGAILSTIYYGYTSDNASVGSGLKNLAQVTQKSATQNGTQDSTQNGTQNSTNASATSQNNVSQQTPATAGVATTQSGQQIAAESTQNSAQNAAAQIAQEVAQNDNAASRTVEEAQQGTKQNYDYYTALQQQQSIPQTEAADPKQEVQAPTTVQVTAQAPGTAAPINSAGQRVAALQQNTEQPAAPSQTINGSNPNRQIVSGGQTNAFPVVNTPQAETQSISQSTAQSVAQVINPPAEQSTVTTMVAANTATATANTNDDGIPMATILTEEQAASMRQSGDKTIVSQGQPGATEVTSLPVISSQTQGGQQGVARPQSVGVTQIAKVADPNFPTRGLTPKGQFYMLQVAAYHSFSQADTLKAKLALSGIETLIQRVSTGGKPTYRVRLGPFINYSNLARAEEKLNTLGLVPQKFLQRDAG